MEILDKVLGLFLQYENVAVAVLAVVYAVVVRFIKNDRIVSAEKQLVAVLGAVIYVLQKAQELLLVIDRVVSKVIPDRKP